MGDYSVELDELVFLDEQLSIDNVMFPIYLHTR